MRAKAQAKVENLNVSIAMMAQFRLVSARIQRISGDGTEHRRKEGLSKVRFAPPSPLVGCTLLWGTILN